MTSTIPYSPTRTETTCTKCQKPTSVPFVPTPGRPVYCRDCFAKTGSGPPRGGPMGFRGASDRPRAPVPGARKRMMAQGRKTHFIYDAKAIIAATPGGMDEKDNRAFLESLFAKGARGSTDDAQVFLEQKVHDKAVTHDQAVQLGKLIDKYSFVR